MEVQATSLRKVFNRRVIFDDVSFSLEDGKRLLITGKNGSGKSTLLKILAHVLTPTSGTVEIRSKAGDEFPLYRELGFVSPYLNLYDEFTAVENLRFGLSVRGMKDELFRIETILDRVGLRDSHSVPTRVFSSGMKQRLKYAFALVHRPSLLLLDEPMSNLDEQGKSVVREIIDEQRKRGVLVVATNDLSDLDQYDAKINLSK